MPRWWRLSRRITPRAVLAARRLRWRRCCAFTCLQQWFSLSGPAMEEAFFDVPLHREFARLDAHGRLPDKSTILRFRQRLKKYKLADGILKHVYDLLRNRAKNAIGMNCKLVLRWRSQFFHSRLLFSSQAKLRSTTQRLGMTANLCNSLRLAICTVAASPGISRTSSAKGSPT